MDTRRFGAAIMLGLAMAAAFPGAAQAGAVSVRISSRPAALTAQTHLTFTFAASRGATVFCRVDALPRKRCSRSVSYDNLPDGRHVFLVQAAYRGHTATASYRFAVDTTGPSQPAGSGGSVYWQDHAITLCGGGASDDHGVSYQSREQINRGSWGAPHPGRCVLVSRTASTKVQFRGVDSLGNPGPWSAVGNGSIARVDTIAPDAPEFVTGFVTTECAQHPLAFRVKARDTGSGVSHYVRQSRVNFTGPFSAPVGFLPGTTLVDHAIGLWTIQVWAVDRAGNESPASTMTLCIDPDVPPDIPPTLD
jgi:hypothetical protein